ASGVSASSLTIGGATTIEASRITTTGGQTYSGAVSLDAAATLTGTTLQFGAAVNDGNAAGTDGLVINGNAHFAGPIGGSRAPGAVQVFGTALFGGSLSASSLLVTGTTTIDASILA